MGDRRRLGVREGEGGWLREKESKNERGAEGVGETESWEEIGNV